MTSECSKGILGLPSEIHDSILDYLSAGACSQNGKEYDNTNSLANYARSCKLLYRYSLFKRFRSVRFGNKSKLEKFHRYIVKYDPTGLAKELMEQILQVTVVHPIHDVLGDFKVGKSGYKCSQPLKRSLPYYKLIYDLTILLPNLKTLYLENMSPSYASESPATVINSYSKSLTHVVFQCEDNWCFKLSPHLLSMFSKSTSVYHLYGCMLDARCLVASAPGTHSSTCAGIQELLLEGCRMDVYTRQRLPLIFNNLTTLIVQNPGLHSDLLNAVSFTSIQHLILNMTCHRLPPGSYEPDSHTSNVPAANTKIYPYLPNLLRNSLVDLQRLQTLTLIADPCILEPVSSVDGLLDDGQSEAPVNLNSILPDLHHLQQIRRLTDFTIHLSVPRTALQDYQLPESQSEWQSIFKELTKPNIHVYTWEHHLLYESDIL